MKTGAHRDELESRSAFLGIIETAKPSADFDAISSRRTWWRSAPATGPGAATLRSITGAATLWRAAAILGDYWKRERKYDNN